MTKLMVKLFYVIIVRPQFLCEPKQTKRKIIPCDNSYSSCHQVFVANPNKPRPILEILLRNKDKLVDFLTKFHTDRSEDEQFNDEKAYLIKQIKELKPLDPPVHH